MYKLIFNNKEAILPKRTLEVEERLHNIKKSVGKYHREEISPRELVEQMYSTVKFFFNDEQIKEFLGTSDINQIDIGELDLLIAEISLAYIGKLTGKMTENKQIAKLIDLAANI